MKTKIKNRIINISIFILIMIIALIIINKPVQEVNKKTAICIGEKSSLYTQLGCHACEIQEKMFEENYKYINVTDCFYEREKCSSIKYTPTWIINNEEYVGFQSIEKLKQLTGC
jgi:hypothetical protein